MPSRATSYGFTGRFLFTRANRRLFLRPALVDRFQAPLGRFLRGPDRLAADRDEDGVGVRRRIDPQATQLDFLIGTSNDTPWMLPSADSSVWATD